MTPSRDEILDYARELKAAKPSISADEMRALLRAKFIDNQDIFHARPGALNNPLDWINGLAAIFRGLGKIFGWDDLSGIKDMIDGVVTIVMEN